jgi:uncharacterized protein with PIN domain
MPSELELLRAALRDNPEMHDRLRRLALAGKLIPAEESPPDEDLTIIASLEHNSMTGAKREQCGRCGCNVWISPSTQAMIAKRTRREGDEFICPPCFARKLEEKIEGGSK